MKAKKFLKTLGIAALIAAVTPYRIEKDEKKDELTVQALLWKVSNYPHPDFEDQRSTSLSIGFHPPVFDDGCGDDCCCEDDCCCGDDCCCEEIVEETPVEETPVEEAPACCCGCEETPAPETPAE